MDVKTELKEFIQKRIGPDAPLNDDDDIFALGYVNSLFALELVTMVESTFDITVENDDLKLENFNSLANLEAFVKSKNNN